MENKIESIKLWCLKSVFIVFLSLLGIRVSAPDIKVAFICFAEPADAYDRLIKAVVQVESAGDCYNFQISKEIFLYYARQTGYPDYETIARNWNGSGNTTLDYWEKVKSNL